LVAGREGFHIFNDFYGLLGLSRAWMTIDQQIPANPDSPRVFADGIGGISSAQGSDVRRPDKPPSHACSSIISGDGGCDMGMVNRRKMSSRSSHAALMYWVDF
jgi:hypothetical protein